MRGARSRRLWRPLLALGLLLALAAPASGAPSGAQRLAEHFAPILELKRQTSPPCDAGGEQYVPSAVEIVLGRPEIVLRAPSGQRERPAPAPAPTAADLYGKGEDWSLDYPGNPYDPACTYARDAVAFDQGTPPVAYAHVVTQADVPGRLALQYWFFYYFNQFNDLHEGDWEMIQLVFAADTPAEAIEREPISVGYSQHDGGERADWDDDKLERQGTHPVVYPAAGSHANYYSSKLWLGRSASEGFGCDDTTGPSRRVVPEARVVREPAAPGDPYAWLAFEGNWGQKARGLFNAPSGPNTNKKWARPLDWDEKLRGSSISVPDEEPFGLSVTDFFCSAVANGSRLYADLLDSPLAASLSLLFLGLVVAGTARLTRWRPVEREPIVAPRAGGQVVRAARQIWWRRLKLLVRIGLIFVPLAALGSALQAGFFEIPVFETVQRVDGAEGGISLPIALIVGGAGSLAAYVIMTAATAEALRRLEAGEPVGAIDAYRALRARWKPLLGALARAAGIVLLLFVSIVGIPWAVRQAVRWGFIPQVVVFEGRGAREALRRSAELVRGRWWRTAMLFGLLTIIGLATGMVAGLLLLFLTTLPLSVVNFVGSLVYVVALPYVAVALTLAYGNCVARPAPTRRRRWWRRTGRSSRSGEEEARGSLGAS